MCISRVIVGASLAERADGFLRIFRLELKVGLRNNKGWVGGCRSLKEVGNLGV